jgi:hypothetical protein
MPTHFGPGNERWIGWRRAGYRSLGWSRRRKLRPWPEWLEDRSLLSPITEYPVPHTTYNPRGSNLEGITARPDGNVWLTEEGNIHSFYSGSNVASASRSAVRMESITAERSTANGDGSSTPESADEC